MSDIKNPSEATWTSKVSMTQYTVHRGNRCIGRIHLRHSGWEARFAGVSHFHSTRAAAIADLIAR